MGVGAKMAKGSVVRSRSLKQFISLPLSGFAGAGWRRRRVAYPLGCPVCCLNDCCRSTSRSGPCLDGAEGLWTHTWQREGGCLGELVEMWGRGGGRGEVSPVSGIRPITLFIPVYGLSSEGD